MSIVIPQSPKELEPFLLHTFNDISLDPLKLKKILQLLRKMCEADAEKKAVFSKIPVFEIVPNALSAEHLNQLLSLTQNKPESTPYNRLRLWSYKFEVTQKGSVISSLQSGVINGIIKIFFEALQAMKEFKEGRWKFAAYIDRNEVNAQNCEKSGLGWHRDRFEDSSDPNDYAHYTLFFLLTDNSLWKSGELGIQLGGEKTKEGAWINSRNPEIHLVPRYNQAIIVKNLNSAHCVAPLIVSEGSIKRDVFILTANHISN